MKHAEDHGPKARFIRAWANGPGIDTHKPRAPSARFIHSASLVAGDERRVALSWAGLSALVLSVMNYLGRCPRLL